MKYRIEDRLVAMTVIECPTCGAPFGMTRQFLETRRRDGQQFYCPNGHDLFYRETEVDRLKQQLAQKEEFWEAQHAFEQAQHEFTRNRLRTVRGHLTRTRKRLAGGVCPCCNRTFENLARHMKTRHPDFARGDKHPECAEQAEP